MYIALYARDVRVGKEELHSAVDQDVKIISDISYVEDHLACNHAFILHFLDHFVEILLLDV